MFGGWEVRCFLKSFPFNPYSLEKFSPISSQSLLLDIHSFYFVFFTKHCECHHFTVTSIKLPFTQPFLAGFSLFKTASIETFQQVAFIFLSKKEKPKHYDITKRKNVTSECLLNLLIIPFSKDIWVIKHFVAPSNPRLLC